MGCATSKYSPHCEINGVYIDDSIHAMLKRERKTKESQGYRPRAAHPLLDNGTVNTDTLSEHDVTHSMEITNNKTLTIVAVEADDQC